MDVMKILYFHQHFQTPATAGGTRSYELAQRLIGRGHAVTMVCGRIGDYGLAETGRKKIRRGMVDGIDVIQLDLSYSNYDHMLKRVTTFLHYGLASIRLALREEYDLLFATSTPLTAAFPGIAMKLCGRRKPFVFEVRDLWPELPRALGMKNPLLLGGMSLLEWLGYRLADGCIGLSPGICKGIARRSPKRQRITMVPNSCDLDLFKPGHRQNLRLDGIGPSDTVAIFTGAHGLANGLHAVLDAAAELQRRNRHDIKLVFIGDGKVKPSLVQRAERDNLMNCRFYDPMPKNRLNQVVASADIGLMILANVPAFYYGTSPNKFFDYIASGLPVLNNYPGWLADLITEHKCGLAVDPDDPVAFADALIALADDPDRCHEMGKNGRVLAEQEFSRDILGNNFVDFIESIKTNEK